MYIINMRQCDVPLVLDDFNVGLSNISFASQSRDKLWHTMSFTPSLMRPSSSILLHVECESSESLWSRENPLKRLLLVSPGGVPSVINEPSSSLTSLEQEERVKFSNGSSERQSESSLESTQTDFREIFEAELLEQDLRFCFCAAEEIVLLERSVFDVKEFPTVLLLWNWLWNTDKLPNLKLLWGFLISTPPE